MQYLSNLIYLPIIFLPLFYWEVPKVWAYLIFINIFTLSTFLIALRRNKDIIIRKNKLTYLILIFFIWSLIASLVFGEDKIKSLVGNYYRFDGLVTTLNLIGFSLIFSSIYNIKDNIKLALSIFISGIVASLWNNFGQINFLVGFLLTTIPFAFYLFENTRNIYLRFGLLFGLILIIKSIIAANSYLGIIGLIIVFPLYLILSKKISKWWILAIISVFITIVSVWFKDITNNKEYVAENRIRIYRNILVAGMSKPFTGYGWSNVDKAFEVTVWPIKFNNDVYVDKAHNLFLEVFATTGLIGLFLFIAVLYMTFDNLNKKEGSFNMVLKTSLIMHLLYSSTNVTSISEEFIFWVIISLAII